jgi:hypothetical protein
LDARVASYTNLEEIMEIGEAEKKLEEEEAKAVALFYSRI